jgi:hypothetical protein
MYTRQGPSLDHLKDWYTGHVNPLADAVNRLDIEASREAAQSARAALDASGLAASDRLKMELVIDYLIEGLEITAGRPDKAQARFDELLARLSTPLGDASADGERLRLQLQLLIIGASGDHCDPSPERIGALLDELPPETRPVELWHYIAYWACLRGDTSLLDQAYEVMAVSHDIGHYGYLWHRVRLLHRLGHGLALTADAVALLAQADAPALKRDFELRIAPLLARAGISI